MFPVRTKLIDQISCTYLISYYLNELYRTLKREDVGWIIHHISSTSHPPKLIYKLVLQAVTESPYCCVEHYREY